MKVGDDEISAVNAAATMNKLLQISAGAVYTDEGDTLEFDIKHRYKVLKEVENLLILQTNNVQSEEDKQPYLMHIGVDQKANELSIDNRIFKRLS